jgi:DHA2 family multidrug resistance protein
MTPATTKTLTSRLNKKNDNDGSTATAGLPSDKQVGSENKFVVSLAVLFGVLMSVIDSSVVNVALPNIQGNLGATQQEITWISTGYMISVVILMPLTNWLSLRFGRKNIYLTSLVVFTAASVMCGMSHTLNELIFWRVIQGLGAGTLQPLAQAILREAFPPEEQAMAMGFFGFVVLFGPAIGPTVGGYITDNIAWPWIFFINLPIGIAGFLFASRFLHDPNYAKGGSKLPIDGWGICFLAIALSTMQTVLEQGLEDDWFQSPFIVILTIISTIATVAFIWRELVIDNPAVDLRILKIRSFTAASVIGCVLGVGLFASLFLLPQYMQNLLGYTATQSGLALMPRSFMMMGMMFLGGWLYPKVGARPMIISGLIMTIFSQWMIGHFTLDTTQEQFLIPQLIQGVGFGMIFVALSTAALVDVDRRNMTSATGLYNLIRQLGGSFGTAAVVTVLTIKMHVARAVLVQNANVDNPAFLQEIQGLAANFVGHGFSATTARNMALKLVDDLINQQAAILGYEYVFYGIGVLFVICIPCVMFMNKHVLRKTPTVASE